LLELLLWRTKHMSKGMFLIFVTPNDKWISLSPKTTSKRCHFWPGLEIYNVASIENNNTCNNNNFSRENRIIRWTNTRRWFHSPCYRDVWMFSFIFYCLCIDHYHASLAIFFSPLNVYFLLLITHVHSLATFVRHNDFSTNYYTLSSYFPHIIANAPSSLADLWQTIALSFLGLLCYCWLSFHSHRSYVHRAFTLFLLIVCFCFFFSCVYLCFFCCLVLLMDGFPLWLLYTWFFFLFCFLLQVQWKLN